MNKTNEELVDNYLEYIYYIADLEVERDDACAECFEWYDVNRILDEAAIETVIEAAEEKDEIAILTAKINELEDFIDYLDLPCIDDLWDEFNELEGGYRMKYKFNVKTDKVGSIISEIVEVDDEDLADKDEQGREDVLGEYLDEWLWNNIEAWYEEAEEEEEEE